MNLLHMNFRKSTSLDTGENISVHLGYYIIRRILEELQISGKKGICNITIELPSTTFCIPIVDHISSVFV